MGDNGHVHWSAKPDARPAVQRGSQGARGQVYCPAPVVGYSWMGSQVAPSAAAVGVAGMERSFAQQYSPAPSTPPASGDGRCVKKQEKRKRSEPSLQPGVASGSSVKVPQTCMESMPAVPGESMYSNAAAPVVKTSGYSGGCAPSKREHVNFSTPGAVVSSMEEIEPAVNAPMVDVKVDIDALVNSVSDDDPIGWLCIEHEGSPFSTDSDEEFAPF